MAGLEGGPQLGECALAVFEEGMDDGDVHLLGAAFDVDAFAGHAQGGHEGGVAVAGRAVHDGEEDLGRAGADEGHVGIGEVALDDGQAGVVADGDLAVMAVEAGAFGAVERDHVGHFAGGEGIGKDRRVQLPGIAEFFENVEAAAGRPVGGDGDGHAGLLGGPDVGGAGVKLHVRHGRPDKLGAGGTHIGKVGGLKSRAMDDRHGGIEHAPALPGGELRARDGVGALAQVDDRGVDGTAGDLGEEIGAVGSRAFPREDVVPRARGELLHVEQNDVGMGVFGIRIALALDGDAAGHQFEAFAVFRDDVGRAVADRAAQRIAATLPFVGIFVTRAPFVAVPEGEVVEHQRGERIVGGMVVDVEQAGVDDAAGVDVGDAGDGDVGDGEDDVVAHVDGPIGAGAVGGHDHAAQGVFEDGAAFEIRVEAGGDEVGEREALDGRQGGVAGPDVAVGRARADEEIAAGVAGLPIDAAVVPIGVADDDVRDPHQHALVGLGRELVAADGRQRHGLIRGEDEVVRNGAQLGQGAGFLHERVELDPVAGVGPMVEVRDVDAAPRAAAGIRQGVAGGVGIGRDAGNGDAIAGQGGGAIHAVLDVRDGQRAADGGTGKDDGIRGRGGIVGDQIERGGMRNVGDGAGGIDHADVGRDARRERGGEGTDGKLRRVAAGGGERRQVQDVRGAGIRERERLRGSGAGSDRAERKAGRRRQIGVFARALDHDIVEGAIEDLREGEADLSGGGGHRHVVRAVVLGDGHRVERGPRGANETLDGKRAAGAAVAVGPELEIGGTRGERRGGEGVAVGRELERGRGDAGIGLARVIHVGGLAAGPAGGQAGIRQRGEVLGQDVRAAGGDGQGKHPSLDDKGGKEGFGGSEKVHEMPRVVRSKVAVCKGAGQRPEQLSGQPFRRTQARSHTETRRARKIFAYRRGDRLRGLLGSSFSTGAIIHSYSAESTPSMRARRYRMGYLPSLYSMSQTQMTVELEP